MKETNNIEIEKLRDIIESNNFKMTVYESDGNIFTELEMWTDSANEDCIVDISGGTVKEFLDELNEYIEYFDEEEYERPWIEMSKAKRIEKGAPESIMDLLNSAHEFKESLDTLYYECKIYYESKMGNDK